MCNNLARSYPTRCDAIALTLARPNPRKTRESANLTAPQTWGKNVVRCLEVVPLITQCRSVSNSLSTCSWHFLMRRMKRVKIFSSYIHCCDVFPEFRWRIQPPASIVELCSERDDDQRLFVTQLSQSRDAVGRLPDLSYGEV